MFDRGFAQIAADGKAGCRDGESAVVPGEPSHSAWFSGSPPHSTEEAPSNLLTYSRAIKRHLVSGRAPVIDMNEIGGAVAAVEVCPDAGGLKVGG